MKRWLVLVKVTAILSLWFLQDMEEGVSDLIEHGEAKVLHRVPLGESGLDNGPQGYPTDSVRSKKAELPNMLPFLALFVSGSSDLKLE